jgi:hypothetical protein
MRVLCQEMFPVMDDNDDDTGLSDVRFAVTVIGLMIITAIVLAIVT